MLAVITFLGRWAIGIVLAVAITLGLFMILPLMQQIGKAPADLVAVREITVAELEAPPEIEEEEPPEEEPEEEVEQPELIDEPLQLDLNQLELALNPQIGGGILNPEIGINLNNVIDQGGGLDELVDLDSVDEKPRPQVTVQPQYNDAMRRVLKQTTVRIVVRVLIDERGRVTDARIHQGNPAFDQAVLRAIKQWRFEPAKRKGKPVPGRVAIPFDFPKGT